MPSRGRVDGHYQERLQRAEAHNARARSFSPEAEISRPALPPRGGSICCTRPCARKHSDNEENDNDQLKAFTQWINTHLSTLGVSDHIENNVSEEFTTNAVIPVRLLEALTKQRAAGVNLQPESVRERRGNIAIFLELLATLPLEGTLDMSPSDLLDDENKVNTRRVLALMFRLICAVEFGPTNQHFLETWVREELFKYRGSPIDERTGSDFWLKSFSNGILFCDLLCRFKPELEPTLLTFKGDESSRLKLAFEYARSHFGVEVMLSPERVAAGKVDQKCMLVYVASLRRAFEDPLRELRTELQRQRDQWLSEPLPTVASEIRHAQTRASDVLARLAETVSERCGKSCSHTTSSEAGCASLFSASRPDDVLQSIWQETKRAGEKLLTHLEAVTLEGASELEAAELITTELVADNIAVPIASADVHQEKAVALQAIASPTKSENSGELTPTCMTPDVTLAQEQPESMTLEASGGSPWLNTFVDVVSASFNVPNSAHGDASLRGDGMPLSPLRVSCSIPKRHHSAVQLPRTPQPATVLALPASGPALISLPLLSTVSGSSQPAEHAAVEQIFRRSLGEAEQQIQTCQTQMKERVQAEEMKLEDHADDHSGALALLATRLAEMEMGTPTKNLRHLEADVKQARLDMAVAEAERADSAEGSVEKQARAKQQIQAALKTIQRCEQAQQAAESLANTQRAKQQVLDLIQKRVILEATRKSLQSQLKSLDRQVRAVQKTLTHLELELSSQVCEWQWEAEDGTFKPYDEDSQRRLEAAYLDMKEGRKRCQEISFKSEKGMVKCNVLYLFNRGEWCQVHAQNHHRRRRVQRVPVVPDKSASIVDAFMLLLEKRMEAEKTPQSTCCFAPWRSTTWELREVKHAHMELSKKVIDEVMQEAQNKDVLAQERERLARVHQGRLNLQASKWREHTCLCRQHNSLKAQLADRTKELAMVNKSLSSTLNAQDLKRTF